MNIEKEKRISPKGLAIIIIIGITPFNRYLLNGRGMIYWALLIGIMLFVFSLQHADLSKHIIRLDETNRVRIGIIGINILLAMSVLFSPFSNPLTLNTSKIQLCAIILFSCILNTKEEKIASVVAFVGSLILIYMYFYSSSTRGGIRTYIELQEGIYLDPNMVSAAFIVPCAYALNILTDHKNVLTKCGMITYLGVWLYTSFMGGSRSGLMVGFVGIVVFVLAKYRISAKTAFYALASIGFVVVVYSIIDDYLSIELLQRMTISNVLASDGSGRTSIWSSHIKLFFSGNLFRILIGYGRESCANVAGISAHNILIDYMWDLGLIGMILYLIVTFAVVKYCLKSRNAVSISIIFSAVIWSWTISASNQLIYWVLIYFAFVVAYNHRKKSIGEEVPVNEDSIRNSRSLNGRNRTYGSYLG